MFPIREEQNRAMEYVFNTDLRVLYQDLRNAMGKLAMAMGIMYSKPLPVQSDVSEVRKTPDEPRSIADLTDDVLVRSPGFVPPYGGAMDGVPAGQSISFPEWCINDYIPLKIPLDDLWSGKEEYIMGPSRSYHEKGSEPRTISKFEAFFDTGNLDVIQDKPLLDLTPEERAEFERLLRKIKTNLKTR